METTERQRTKDEGRQIANAERRRTKDEGRMANDKRRTTNDERRTTNDERRTTNDERQTANDERRTTNDERRTTNDDVTKSNMYVSLTGSVHLHVLVVLVWNNALTRAVLIVHRLVFVHFLYVDAVHALTMWY